MFVDTAPNFKAPVPTLLYVGSNTNRTFYPLSVFIVFLLTHVIL